MRKYEYDALLKAVDDQKEAGVAFCRSYVKGEKTYDKLCYPREKYMIKTLPLPALRHCRQ
jgi:hypothetical protein